MSCHWRRVCQALGFTLVELLVVISVIAILASLVMPALQTANAKAKESKCISNLRQISQGFGLYRITYRDFMPSPCFLNRDTIVTDDASMNLPANYDFIPDPADPEPDPDKKRGWDSWRGRLLPYIGNASDSRDERYAIMKCPSVRTFTIGATSFRSFYGINAYAGMATNPEGAVDPTTTKPKYLHIEDFQSPSETLLIGENNKGHWAVKPLIPKNATDFTAASDEAKSYARHSSRGCWVYADGHSDSLRIIKSEERQCYAWILTR